MAKSDIEINMRVLKDSVCDITAYELEPAERGKARVLVLAGLSLLHQFLLDIHKIAYPDDIT